MHMRFFVFPLIARETPLSVSLESTPLCTIGWQKIRELTGRMIPPRSEQGLGKDEPNWY